MTRRMAAPAHRSLLQGALPEPRPIRTLKSLRSHLQTAIELEHSTIPPYLCALYSIKDGHNRDAARVIQSVAMEEMLHLVLAANVLNAIGGEPAIDRPTFIPHYPGYMPHSRNRFVVGLEKFSPRSLDTFLKIETPAKPSAEPQADEYETIGQFYQAIEDGLQFVCRGGRGFVRHHRRQITPEAYYGGGGRLVVVTDLESALRALNEIVDQGEGLDHSFLDGDAVVHGAVGYAHYFRFKEIERGRFYTKHDTVEAGPTGAALRVEWDQVYDMKPNPKSRDYPKGSDLRRKSDAFNRTYSRLLAMLHVACNGRPAAFAESVALMYELKYQAIELMRIPAGVDGQTAGPTFEYVETGKIG